MHERVRALGGSFHLLREGGGPIFVVEYRSERSKPPRQLRSKRSLFAYSAQKHPPEGLTRLGALGAPGKTSNDELAIGWSIVKKQVRAGEFGSTLREQLAIPTVGRG